MEKWFETLRDQGLTVAKIVEALREEKHRDLRELLPDPLATELEELIGNRKNSFSLKLSHALRQRADVVFADGLRLQ